MIMEAPRRTRIAASLVALAVPLVLLGAACGNDDEQSTTETTLTAEETVCATGEEVSASLTAIRELDVLTDGTDAVKAELTSLKASLDELAAAERSSVEAEATALSEAVDEMSSALETDPGTPSEQVELVAGSLADLAAAAGDFAAALPADCE